MIKSTNRSNNATNPQKISEDIKQEKNLRPESFSDFTLASAWIVGTALKRDGRIENEIELANVLRMTDAYRSTGDC